MLFPHPGGHSKYNPVWNTLQVWPQHAKLLPSPDGAGNQKHTRPRPVCIHSVGSQNRADSLWHRRWSLSDLVTVWTDVFKSCNNFHIFLFLLSVVIKKETKLQTMKILNYLFLKLLRKNIHKKSLRKLPLDINFSHLFNIFDSLFSQNLSSLLISAIFLLERMVLLILYIVIIAYH